MICAHCGAEKPARELRGFKFYGKDAKVCRDLDERYLQSAACAARWRRLQEQKRPDWLLENAVTKWREAYE